MNSCQSGLRRREPPVTRWQVYYRIFQFVSLRSGSLMADRPSKAGHASFVLEKTVGWMNGYLMQVPYRQLGSLCVYMQGKLLGVSVLRSSSHALLHHHRSPITLPDILPSRNRAGLEVFQSLHSWGEEYSSVDLVSQSNTHFMESQMLSELPP